MNLKLSLRIQCLDLEISLGKNLLGRSKKGFVNYSSLSELNQLVGEKEFNFINSIDDSSSVLNLLRVQAMGKKKHLPPIWKTKLKFLFCQRRKLRFSPNNASPKPVIFTAQNSYGDRVLSIRKKQLIWHGAAPATRNILSRWTIGSKQFGFFCTEITLFCPAVVTSKRLQFNGFRFYRFACNMILKGSAIRRS